MAGAVNKVILIGNLGKDPELRRTASGAAVTSFSLATTERFTSRDGGRQEQTEWHEIVAWNKSAETMAQYLRKGSSVYIEGKLRTRSWDDNNGQKRYKTEVVVSTFQFLDSKGGNGGGGFSSGGGANDFGEPPMGFDQAPQDNFGGGFEQQQAPAQQQFQQQAPAQPQYQQAPPQQQAAPQQPMKPAAPIQVDDDLPF